MSDKTAEVSSYIVGRAGGIIQVEVLHRSGIVVIQTAGHVLSIHALTQIQVHHHVSCRSAVINSESIAFRKGSFIDLRSVSDV